MICLILPLLLTLAAPPLAWEDMLGVHISPEHAAFALTTYPATATVVLGDHAVGFWCRPDQTHCTLDTYGPQDDGQTLHETYADDSNTGTGVYLTCAAPVVLIITDGSTNPAVVMTRTCPADFNMDGTVDSTDFFDFLAAWFAADAWSDFNTSGTVDTQDYLDFYAVWREGC